MTENVLITELPFDPGKEEAKVRAGNPRVGGVVSFLGLVRDFNDGELRSRYQFHVEIRNGEPWMIGYWQDYNYLDYEKAKGKFFLKRREKPDVRA